MFSFAYFLGWIHSKCRQKVNEEILTHPECNNIELTQPVCLHLRIVRDLRVPIFEGEQTYVNQGVKTAG